LEIYGSLPERELGIIQQFSILTLELRQNIHLDNRFYIYPRTYIDLHGNKSEQYKVRLDLSYFMTTFCISIYDFMAFPEAWGTYKTFIIAAGLPHTSIA